MGTEMSGPRRWVLTAPRVNDVKECLPFGRTKEAQREAGKPRCSLALPGKLRQAVTPCFDGSETLDRSEKGDPVGKA